MPRWYVPALLVGIVTVCAVCLGLRWRVIEQSAPPDTQAVADHTPLLSLGGPPAAPAPGTTPSVDSNATSAAGADPNSTTTDAVPWVNVSADASMPASGAPTGSDPSAVAPTGSAPPTTLAAVPAAPRYPAKPPPVRLNINTATVAQLQALPGVGPVMAQRIVDYRSEHGPFKSVAQLQDVKGIGPKKFAKLQPWAYV